jgi:1-acyl-sn-glycerol-3-phosphate acyltransferase
MSGEEMRAAWYWIAKMACKFFCMLFFRIRFYGQENIPESGAFIFAGNHQSYLDPVFCGIGSRRQLCFMARDSLFANRFFGWLLTSVNAIPIDREKPDISTIKAVITKLKDGKGVCLFPEGTRTSDGRIAEFKPGLGLLCRRTNATIVPVLIDGAFECWPRHKKIFSPGRIIVCYGQAINSAEAASMDDRQLAELLTETLRKMQAECRIRKGKDPYDY